MCPENSFEVFFRIICYLLELINGYYNPVRLIGQITEDCIERLLCLTNIIYVERNSRFSCKMIYSKLKP